MKKEYYELNINVDKIKFENYLKKFLKLNNNIKKNFYTRYYYKNNILSVFKDGSCFCIRYNKQKLKNHKIFEIKKVITKRIMNDEIPPIKDFDIIRTYDIIIVEYNNYQIMFQKIKNCYTNIISYRISIEVSYLKEKDNLCKLFI